MTEPDKQGASRHFIPGLDGLRAIAVLLVLYSHLPINENTRIGQYINLIVRPGFMGVDFFFVLSGFLITRILIYNREKGVPLSNFLVRRASRIFPIYYLVILACFFAYPGSYLIPSALYYSNFTLPFDNSPNPLRHTWSLCVEEHFYMVWPLLASFLPMKFLRPVMFALIGVAIAGSFYIAYSYNKELAYNLAFRVTYTKMLSLSCGALVAYYESQLRDRATIDKWLKIAIISGVVLIGSTPLLNKMGSNLIVVARNLGYCSISVGALLTTLRAGGDSKIGQALSKGVLPWIGKISYGLYLYHYPIYFFTGTISGKASTLVWMGAVVGTFALAYISFTFLESRIMSATRKWTDGWRVAPRLI